MLKTAMKIRFLGLGSKPVVIAFGGKGTRFFGLGVSLGKKESHLLRNQRQLFRMDWKVMGSHYPGDGDNVDYWKDDGFEFHIPKEPG